jgi:hypothetical protein
VTGNMSPSPPRQSAGKRWVRRIGAGIVGILVWLLGGFFSTPVNEIGDNAVERAKSYVFGQDQPIELQPICDELRQGKVIAPHAEKDAAYHYRCAQSRQWITEQQIRRRCVEQWGEDARLVLKDPDSASGWKCHTRGRLR